MRRKCSVVWPTSIDYCINVKIYILKSVLSSRLTIICVTVVVVHLGWVITHRRNHVNSHILKAFACMSSVNQYKMINQQILYVLTVW